MNALDPTVAEFRERLKHQRTEKKRRLNAMNCKPENSRFLARFGMPVRFLPRFEGTSARHDRRQNRWKKFPALNYSARAGREPS
jgi:hypothetical protein